MDFTFGWATRLLGVERISSTLSFPIVSVVSRIIVVALWALSAIWSRCSVVIVSIGIIVELSIGRSFRIICPVWSWVTGPIITRPRTIGVASSAISVVVLGCLSLVIAIRSRIVGSIVAIDVTSIVWSKCVVALWRCWWSI